MDLSSGAYGKKQILFIFKFHIVIFFFNIYFVGWYGWYEENERCYWGIYAPGAQKLRFQLINNFEVSEHKAWIMYN